MLYTTLTALKAYLGITGTAQDAQLTSIIKIVSDQIDQTIGRNLGKATASERYSASGSNIIYLQRKPITVVNTITEDGIVYQNTDIVDFIEHNMLFCKRKLCKGIMNVVVSYEAGYDDTPLDVQSVCHQLCAKLLKSDESHGGVDVSEDDIKSKSMDGLSITYLSGSDIATRIKSEILSHSSILSKYKCLSPRKV